MRKTIFDMTPLCALLNGVSSLLLRLFGWRKFGELPDIPKYILVAAPHTSNWDFPYVLAYAFAYRIKVFWMGKSTMFRRPFGGFFKWLGGVPIDRTKANNVVEQSVELFNTIGKLIMVISPEGTRTKVRRWKTGFYHIAHGAKVPIVLGFLDFRHKIGGFGPMIMPTGNIAADMEKIRAFYATIVGKRPELST